MEVMPLPFLYQVPAESIRVLRIGMLTLLANPRKILQFLFLPFKWLAH